MNYLQIKSKTQEAYKDDTKLTLRLVIFLTCLLKNMHTRKFVFISQLFFCTPFGIYYSISKHILLPFLFSILIILPAYNMVIYLLNREQGETLTDVYNEQACIQETLQEMLRNKL